MQCYPSKYIHPLAWYNLRKGRARHPQIRSSHLGKRCVASALHTFGRLWRGETSSYSVFFLLLITSFPISQKKNKNHFSIHMQAPRLSSPGLLGAWQGRGREGGKRRGKDPCTETVCTRGLGFFKREENPLHEKTHNEFPNIASQGSRLLQLCHEHADFLGLRVPIHDREPGTQGGGVTVLSLRGDLACPCLVWESSTCWQFWPYVWLLNAGKILLVLC